MLYGVEFGASTDVATFFIGLNLSQAEGKLRPEPPCATKSPLWNEGRNHVMFDITDPARFVHVLAGKRAYMIGLEAYVLMRFVRQHRTPPTKEYTMLWCVKTACMYVCLFTRNNPLTGMHVKYSGIVARATVAAMRLRRQQVNIHATTAVATTYRLGIIRKLCFTNSSQSPQRTDDISSPSG